MTHIRPLYTLAVSTHIYIFIKKNLKKSFKKTQKVHKLSKRVKKKSENFGKRRRRKNLKDTLKKWGEKSFLLSVSILGVCTSTTALQSSPLQNLRGSHKRDGGKVRTKEILSSFMGINCKSFNMSNQVSFSFVLGLQIIQSSK